MLRHIGDQYGFPPVFFHEGAAEVFYRAYPDRQRYHAAVCVLSQCLLSASLTMEKDKHSVAAGAIGGVPFRVNEIRLEAGDTVYLYTDGVTEAHNEEKEMFKPSGLLSALNEDPFLSPSELDARVRERVREFMGDAELFDDLTTLCIRYKPGNRR